MLKLKEKCKEFSEMKTREKALIVNMIAWLISLLIGVYINPIIFLIFTTIAVINAYYVILKEFTPAKSEILFPTFILTTGLVLLWLEFFTN